MALPVDEVAGVAWVPEELGGEVAGLALPQEGRDLCFMCFNVFIALVVLLVYMCVIVYGLCLFRRKVATCSSVMPPTRLNCTLSPQMRTFGRCYSIIIQHIVCDICFIYIYI